jgi:hypothetical protein
MADYPQPAGGSDDQFEVIFQAKKLEIQIIHEEIDFSY